MTKTKVENYFDEWASDYNLAFQKEAQEKNPLQKLINFLFRRKTFYFRNKHLEDLILSFKVKNKKILDIGCGPGQAALFAANQGAQVIGLDISKEMIRVAQKNAKKAGLSTSTKFMVKDCVKENIPSADIVFCIAVLEYYKDIDPIIKKMCQASHETLVICDTQFILWRIMLRKLLSYFKGFPVYYHNSTKIETIARKYGFKKTKIIDVHTFRTYVFSRKKH